MQIIICDNRYRIDKLKIYLNIKNRIFSKKIFFENRKSHFVMRIFCSIRNKSCIPKFFIMTYKYLSKLYYIQWEKSWWPIKKPILAVNWSSKTLKSIITFLYKNPILYYVTFKANTLLCYIQSTFSLHKPWFYYILFRALLPK